MPTIRRRTATIRLPSCTPIRQLFMATDRPPLATPMLHECMAMRHLRLPPVVEEDYSDYPPADGDYQATQGEYGEYPANGY